MVEMSLLVVVALGLADPVVGEPDPAETDSAGEPSGGEGDYQFASVQRVAVAEGATRVSVETNAPAPPWGGFPLRVFVDNSTGPSGELHLTLTSRDSGSARRSMTLSAGERRMIDLPLLGSARGGRLTVSGLGLPGGDSASVYFQGVSGENRVVLSLGEPRDFEGFVGRSPSSTSSGVTVMTVSLDEAPSELMAYSGYAAVVLPAPRLLERLDETQRRALEAYVATGGLLVLKTPTGHREALPLLRSSAEGSQPYGFGRVVLTQGAWPVPWWARPAVDPSGPPWVREQLAARPPVVLLPQAQAPVGRFFLIIGVFTLAIGPGSIWVARRRGPAALVLTIPGTALVTCGVIASYSLVADGFTLHAASYGLTLLDGKNHRAITLGLGAYYANLAPRRASYSAMTSLVSPSDAREHREADLTWNDGLTMGAGFIPSRLYREWGVLAVEPSRARLRLKRAGGGWHVQNALGSPITEAWVRLDGVLFSVRSVPDGAEAALERDPKGIDLEMRAAERFRPEALSEVTGANGAELGPDEFVACLGGAGFVPTGGLVAALEEGVHYVRGEVER